MITSDGPTSLIVVAGKSITLGCETEGDPRPQVPTRVGQFETGQDTPKFTHSALGSKSSRCTSLFRFIFTVISTSFFVPTNKWLSRAQITWRKDLNKIDFFATDHKYMLKESGSLFVDSADVTDTARFLCVVENPAGVVTREITLTVHGEAHAHSQPFRRHVSGVFFLSLVTLGFFVGGGGKRKTCGTHLTFEDLRRLFTLC